VQSDPSHPDIEVVLDIQDDLVKSGFVHQREAQMTVIDKLKMNSDHSKIGFTVDIGNQEIITGGIKCMKTNKILSHIRLENISSMNLEQMAIPSTMWRRMNTTDPTR